MKGAVVFVVSFLALIFVCHMLYGNPMPSMDELVSRFEDSFPDIDTIIVSHSDLRDFWREFMSVVEYGAYLPGDLGPVSSDTPWFLAIVAYIQYIAKIIVTFITIPFKWLISSFVRLGFIITEALGSVGGILSILFGVGA